MQGVLQHPVVPGHGRPGEINELCLVDFGLLRKPRFSPQPDANDRDRLLHQTAKVRAVRIGSTAFP
jgi:hypothetical protein